MAVVVGIAIGVGAGGVGPTYSLGARAICLRMRMRRMALAPARRVEGHGGRVEGVVEVFDIVVCMYSCFPSTGCYGLASRDLLLCVSASDSAGISGTD